MFLERQCVHAGVAGQHPAPEIQYPKRALVPYIFLPACNNQRMMFTHDDPVLELEDEQCWKLLENTQHGRLVLTAVGETDIFPINFRAHDGVLTFRTAPGTKLAELTVNEQVVLQADGISSDEAWSVVVKGVARVLEHSSEIAAAEALNLKSWVPTLKDFYVEITPSKISGRHFNFGEQPERF